MHRRRVLAAELGGAYGRDEVDGYARVDGCHEGGLSGEVGVVLLKEGGRCAVECGVWVWVDQEAGDGLDLSITLAIAH